MPNKIQDIVDKFKEEHKDPRNSFSTHQVYNILQSSLTSLLDSIEKELPKEIPINLDMPLENIGRDVGKNLYRQEVINIINSHR